MNVLRTTFCQLITKEEGLELYEDMVLGRSFEDMCAQMYTTEAKFGIKTLRLGCQVCSPMEWMC